MSGYVIFGLMLACFAAPVLALANLTRPQQPSRRQQTAGRTRARHDQAMGRRR